MTGLLLRLAQHARVPWIVAAVAFVLTLPLLGAGYFLDDKLHGYILRGGSFPGGPRGDWDLYRFADGAEGARAGIDSGLFPWWTSPELKLAFFRPLASYWRAADHHLWGEESWVPHLETSIAYALLALIAAKLYALWLSEPGQRSAAAGLAALMFAVDDAHAMVVTWVANRYALLATLLGIASLLLLALAPARRAFVLLSALVFGLALLSGELAIGVLGYLAAHAWFSDPSRRRASFLRLAPHACMFLAWAVTYRLLGYGASGNAFYVDPVHDPLAFALKAGERLPQLALAQLFGPPSELWGIAAPDARLAVIVGTLLASAAIFTFVWRLARHHRMAPVFAWGGLLAAVPMCATNADDRLLLLPGFGAFGLVAIAFERVWAEAGAGRVTRVAIATLAVAHLAIAPLLLPLRGLNSSRMLTTFVARGASSIPAGAELPGSSFVILGTPDVLMTNYMFMDRFFASTAPPPSRLMPILSVQNDGTATVERTADRTFVIRNPRGMNGGPWTTVYRKDPFAAGERIHVSGLDVEVLELGAGGLPTAIAFTFEESVSGQRWLYWQDGKFAEVGAVGVGETLAFEGTPLVDALK